MNKLFPYVLYRICGINFDIWEKYRLNTANIISLRTMLQKDILHPNITFSLPSSSLLFAEKVEEWAKKNPAFFRKRERQTERTALKYLSRASAKASPFAAFTTLQIIDNQSYIDIIFQNKSNLNIKYLSIIYEFLPKIRVIRNQLLVTLNDTCFSENGNILFIQNEKNEERLQILEQDEIVVFFLDFFKNKEKITFSDLCWYLDDENAENFLLQLLEIGFLSWQMPFTKHYNAISIVTELLKKVENDILENEKEVFERLNSILKRLNSGNFIDFGLRKEELFYHDIASNHTELKDYDKELSPFYNNTADIFYQLQKIVYPLYKSELSCKIDFVLTKNKSKNLKISELYKHVFHNEKVLKIKPFISDEKQNQLLDFFEKKIPISDVYDVNITNNLIEEIAIFVTSIFERNDNLLSPSANLILQPFRENGDYKAVLNGASIGFGKQFARFLPMFDEKVTSDFKNENTNSKVRLAELNDASFFNGNQHPNLVATGINTPNTLPFSEQNILANHLIIKKLDNEWVLFDTEKNERVIPLDLGIEHPAFRSPYYQLLHHFSYKIANFRIFNDYINVQYPKHKKPRISIDNQLVTQRMTWFFEVSALPFLQKNQSESDYFYAVQKWQKMHDLPNLVYVSIPHFQPENNQINSDAAPQGDDYKPQMIDFQNPMLISLFARIVKKVPSQLVVEEMLPTEEQIFSFDHKKYMMEAVIQISEK